MNDSNNYSDFDEENARVGYQAALSYAANEKQLVWVRTSGIMVANTIFIAIINSLFNTAAKADASPKIMLSITIAFTICGLLICFFWIALMEHTKKFSDFYVWSARKLEEEHLKPIETLKLGGRLTDDKGLREQRKCLKSIPSNNEYGQVTIVTKTAVKTIKIEGLWHEVWQSIKDFRILANSKSKIVVPRAICLIFIIIYAGYLILSIIAICEPSILMAKTEDPKQSPQLELDKSTLKTSPDIRGNSILPLSTSNPTPKLPNYQIESILTTSSRNHIHK